MSFRACGWGRMSLTSRQTFHLAADAIFPKDGGIKPPILFVNKNKSYLQRDGPTGGVLH